MLVMYGLEKHAHEDRGIEVRTEMGRNVWQAFTYIIVLHFFTLRCFNDDAINRGVSTELWSTTLTTGGNTGITGSACSSFRVSVMVTVGEGHSSF
jgi:hypothetical protein